MEEDIVAVSQPSRQKQSWGRTRAASKSKSPKKKRSSFPSIPIKVPGIIEKLKSRSRRKGRSISIPEEVVVTSENAPVTLYAKKKRDGPIEITPPQVRRRTIMESIDKATSMEKATLVTDTPVKPTKKKATGSPSSIKRVRNDGTLDSSRLSTSYSTMKTADMSTSTSASPHSPHSLGSMGRHKNRIRQSMSPSKSSLGSTPEISTDFSPGNDSKRSLTISELQGSRQSLTVSELGASFSTRPSSYSARPPRSFSSHRRTTGSVSAHNRTSGSLSAHNRTIGSVSAHNRTSGSISSHLRHNVIEANFQDIGSSSQVTPESFRSNEANVLDTSSPSVRSAARSIANSITSSRSGRKKKTEKTLSLAQSSSIASLEQYGKLAQRRSSATLDSLITAKVELDEELESSGELSLRLNKGDTSGSKRYQRATSNSARSQRSILSSRSLRSGSRRPSKSPSSRRQRSKSPSQRQRSLHDIVTDSFISTSSSDGDGISSLEDSPSVEEIMRRNNLPKAKEKPPQRRRSSAKDRNDIMDRSLMRNRSSRDPNMSHHSKSQESFDRFFNSSSYYDSTSSMAARGGSRRSTRTGDFSKRSSKTAGNPIRSSGGSSRRGSKPTDNKKKGSPRRKSDAAALRGIPRTIEFVTNAEESKTPQSPMNVSSGSSSKTSSCRSSSSKSSSGLSPVPSTSRSSSSKSSKLSPIPSASPMKKLSRKHSPKTPSSGARILFKAKKSKTKFKKESFQKSPASQATESLPSLFGTALCLDISSHHQSTTSPFMQYDISLNDAMPQTAIRRKSLGSLSRSRNSFGSLDGESGRASLSRSSRFPKHSFGSLDGSADFVLTEEEEGCGSGGMTSPSVSLASDFVSATSSSLVPPPAGLRLPTLQQKKKRTKKKPVATKKKKKKKKKPLTSSGSKNS